MPPTADSTAVLSDPLRSVLRSVQIIDPAWSCPHGGRPLRLQTQLSSAVRVALIAPGAVDGQGRRPRRWRVELTDGELWLATEQLSAFEVRALVPAHWHDWVDEFSSPPVPRPAMSCERWMARRHI